jgi:alkanesulfonate monooxygenase SsuD/methylene tetrahydromethanopterin reductase-like flavin-dependent oxidoreductase (luciferase family)
MRYSAFSVTDHYVDTPRTIAAFYDELIAEIVLAEELGFDTYVLAEHHFHEYGIVPNPTVLLAATSQKTSRIGLGVAVSLLVFHNPLVTAEEYAMIDQLSGGRLRLGMGSGCLAHEFDEMRIGPWEKRARFDEATEILRRAWPGEPFSYHGLYHHVENTRIAVTPVQQPEPENWIAVIRPEAADHVGRQGRNIMLVPYATADTIDETTSRRSSPSTGGAGPKRDTPARATSPPRCTPTWGPTSAVCKRRSARRCRSTSTPGCTRRATAPTRSSTPPASCSSATRRPWRSGCGAWKRLASTTS